MPIATLSYLVRHFNRFELKYLLSVGAAHRFKAALGGYLLPDDHGTGGQGCYGVASLYYDSPDHRCYWEKMEGLKFRRKLRIRRYSPATNSATSSEGAGVQLDTPVYVEIKQRVDRATQKRRVLLPYKDSLQLCSKREAPPYPTQGQALIDEVLAYTWQYNLQPASIVRYQRQAWIGTDYDAGLRVTFDTQVTCQVKPSERSSLDLRDEAGAAIEGHNRLMLPADLVIMEIKVNERIPYWLTELVAAHNLRLVRISKYCRSIAMANQKKDDALANLEEGSSKNQILEAQP